MSASGHDAIPEFPGKVLRIDAPAPVAPDFTEDLADEITSELGPAARRLPAIAAPAVDRADAEEEKPVHSAFVTSGSVLRERYVLETQLGNGGTATVFRAVDLRRDAASADGHRVAIKLLRPELRDRPQNIARLQREFRQTQSIAHPNVVRYHDLDCDRGSWFIVMELLTGETLGPCLRRSTPQGLRKAEALRIAVAVGEALSHAHAQGITHGDVKPDNIFLTTSGEVRLLDFGVAPESTMGAAAGDAPARQVIAAATRVYASPEVLSGDDPEPRDDVFSLACVIYEMLAGFHPYGRRGADNALRAHLVPAPVAELDSDRQETLAAALDLSRAARPTMEGLVRAVRGESPPQALPVLEISNALPEVTAPVVAPPIDVARSAATPAAALAIVALQRPALIRARLTWLSAIAAVMALVLGILIGRLDTEPPAAVAQVATSPVVDTPAVTAPPEVSAPTVLPPEAAIEPETRSEGTPVQEGLPPGLVSFDSATMIVSKRAVVAAIPLRHLNRSKVAVNVSWRVIDGTARAGRDYGGASTGVETFIEGNTFRILYVPIVTNARANGDRTFTVELTGASAGATVGTMRRIEVTILGDA